MDTQTQIDRLIELAIIQRSELKQLVEQLPQLREHLNAEVEKVFDETEPQLRSELEEWTTKQTADKTAALGVALEAKIADLAKSLEVSTQARYNAIIAEREENARLAAQAEAKIAEHAASLPGAVKEIVSAELARFPRAGEINQLRKEFAEPRGLNPRGKWQAGETYNKLDLVTINGDSYTSNTDGNRTRPSRSSADWTLVAARGTGGGGGPTSLSELTTVPSDGDLLIGSGTSWVTSNLTAGAGISITVGPGAITISATDGDITLDDGTAASPSLHFTNDADTGIYRPAANTLGISTSGVQRMYVDQNGITTVGAGGTFDGSVHAANGNANNPSFSFSSDQDTGFFRHQPNEIGVALGGTQKATLTSTTFTITPNLVVSGTGSINGTTIPASKTLVVTTDKLSALASTSSSELAGVISDETGTGALVFANTPTLVTPNIGAATGTSVNLSGAGTFGGNLTVSGGTVDNSPASGGPLFRSIRPANTGSAAFASIPNGALSASNVEWYSGLIGSSGDYKIWAYNGSTNTFAFTSTPAGNVTLAGNLTVSGTGNSTFSGNLNLNGTDKSILLNGASTQFSREIDVRISGDTEGRLLIRGGGSLLWGDGAGGYDSTLARTAANMLTVTGGLTTSGNLTVSGTGTSSFSGQIRSASGTTQLNVGVIGGGMPYVQGYDSASSSTTGIAFYTNAEQMRLFANGNLGLGTGSTDSGNGKLQLATHTTSAGGIGFGSDVSLFRNGTSSLTANANINSIWAGATDGSMAYHLGVLNTSAQSSGMASGIAFGNNISNTANTVNITAMAGITGVKENGTANDYASQLKFWTRANGASLTTALTLDSSQNAIFAKDVRVQAATSALTWFKDSTPTKAWGIGSNGWAGLSGGDGSMIFGVYNGSAWSKALELDNATQNATFAGDVSIVKSSAVLKVYDSQTVVGGGGGEIFLQHRNSGASQTSYASVKGYATNGTIGAEDGDLYLKTMRAGTLTLGLKVTNGGSVVVNDAAVATNATRGFLYVSGCAGTPTGTPETHTGRVPIVVDTTNNKLYFYSGGAWRDAGP